jgi:hypothetical protein
MLDWLRSFKKLLQENLLTKLTAIFVSGSIGQKVAVIIGLVAVVIGIWKAFIPLLISVAGLIIMQLAIKDYESSKEASKEASKEGSKEDA